MLPFNGGDYDLINNITYGNVCEYILDHGAIGTSPKKLGPIIMRVDYSGNVQRPDDPRPESESSLTLIKTENPKKAWLTISGFWPKP